MRLTQSCLGAAFFEEPHQPLVGTGICSMKDPKALRASAEEARRLARGIGSTADRLQLIQLANELDAKALAGERERTRQGLGDQTSLAS
jgi:hypothetical protein